MPLRPPPRWGGGLSRPCQDAAGRLSLAASPSGRPGSVGWVKPTRTASLLLGPLASALALAGCTGSGTTTTTVTVTEPVTRTVTQTVSPPPATTTTAPPTTSATATGACDFSALRAALVRSGAAAGSTYATIALRNTGTGPCRLLGYPGVSAVDSAGHQLGAPADRRPGATPTAQVVAPGASTSFVLQASNVANLDPASCRPVDAAGYRIYPPGSRTSVVLPVAGGRACTTTAVFLHTGPVGAG